MTDAGEGGPVWPVSVAWGALVLMVFARGVRPAWHGDAACRNAEPELMDGGQSKAARARQVCAGCLVRRECLSDVVAWETASGTRAAHPAGTRAGLTATERAALYRVMPGSVGAPGEARRRPRRR